MEISKAGINQTFNSYSQTGTNLVPAIENIMTYKAYSKQQEERQSRTAEGAKMLAESKAQIAKVKSMPRRMMSSTGSMVRRAVEKVLPKRVIEVKK